VRISASPKWPELPVTNIVTLPEPVPLRVNHAGGNLLQANFGWRRSGKLLDLPRANLVSR
jgi:hypothetical protein